MKTRPQIVPRTIRTFEKWWFLRGVYPMLWHLSINLLITWTPW